jgi:hypothetical protein
MSGTAIANVASGVHQGHRPSGEEQAGQDQKHQHGGHHGQRVGIGDNTDAGIAGPIT